MKWIALIAVLAFWTAQAFAEMTSSTPFLDGRIQCHQTVHAHRCNFVSSETLMAASHGQQVARRQETLWNLKTKSEKTGCVPVHIETILACQSEEWVMDEGNAGKFEIIDLMTVKKPMWIR